MKKKINLSLLYITYNLLWGLLIIFSGALFIEIWEILLK